MANETERDKFRSICREHQLIAHEYTPETWFWIGWQAASSEVEELVNMLDGFIEFGSSVAGSKVHIEHFQNWRAAAESLVLRHRKAVTE